ncbi:MAG: LysR family transcriptional regulator [Eggerthella lenta]
MELQQLRYFDEVARTQHVTNSAKKLNVAQPALTQSIRRLERELGVTLFERVGRNVRLTACGEALQKRIAPLLAALDELPEELAVVAGQQRAAVHLAIESASGLAVDAIAAYRSAHPDARFVVTQEASSRRWDLRVRTVRAEADPRARRSSNASARRARRARRAGTPAAVRPRRRAVHLPRRKPHVSRGMRRSVRACRVRAARGVR